jgi:hypothetical protein
MLATSMLRPEGSFVPTVERAATLRHLNLPSSPSSDPPPPPTVACCHRMLHHHPPPLDPRRDAPATSTAHQGFPATCGRWRPFVSPPRPQPNTTRRLPSAQGPPSIARTSLATTPNPKPIRWQRGRAGAAPTSAEEEEGRDGWNWLLKDKLIGDATFGRWIMRL